MQALISCNLGGQKIHIIPFVFFMNYDATTVLVLKSMEEILCQFFEYQWWLETAMSISKRVEFILEKNNNASLFLTSHILSQPKKVRILHRNDYELQNPFWK